MENKIQSMVFDVKMDLIDFPSLLTTSGHLRILNSSLIDRGFRCSCSCFEKFGILEHQEQKKSYSKRDATRSIENAYLFSLKRDREINSSEFKITFDFEFPISLSCVI